MTEIFTNIHEEVKQTAATIWELAQLQHNPIQAAELLDASTNYYRHLLSEEEIEFLQFYFNMKMEELSQ